MLFFSEQWLLSGILAVLVVALFFVESKKGGKSLSHHEVTRMVNGDEAIIVDVRDTNEYKSGHIVDALNIPHSKLAKRHDELEKYKAKTIIVVDKLGQHTTAAAKLLRDNGYTVNRMAGGMTDWVAQSLPVIKG